MLHIRDLISSSSSLSVITWKNRTNRNRVNPEEPWQRRRGASRHLPAKRPEKLCSSAPRAKADLNAKDGHTKCWFNLVNISSAFAYSHKSICDYNESSFYSMFIQVPKTYNSTVALQGGVLKHLGDVATVLLDLVCLGLFCFFLSLKMMMRSGLCVEHWLLSDSLCKLKSHYYNYSKINVWKCKPIFPTDILQQNIVIPDLKQIFNWWKY